MNLRPSAMLRASFIAAFLFVLGMNAYTVSVSGALSAGEPPAAVTSTPSAALSSDPTPGAPPSTPQILTIPGKVVADDERSLPAGLAVTLFSYDLASADFSPIARTQTLSDGSFQFADVDVSTLAVLLAAVQYNEVTFTSDIFYLEEASLPIELTITVYEAAYDLAGLTCQQMHVIFDFSTEGAVQVIQVFDIANPTGKIVVGDDAAAPLLQFELPEGATTPQAQDAAEQKRFIQNENQLGYLFTLGPGEKMQVVFAYQLGYTSPVTWLPLKPQLKLSLLAPLPVEEVQVMLPQVGVSLRSSQLKASGTQSSDSQTYDAYTASDLTQGSPLKITLSGSVESGESKNFFEKNMPTILTTILGILFFALAAAIYLHQRQRPRLADAPREADDRSESDVHPCPSLQEAAPDTPIINALLDEILNLEDRFAAGEISQEDFERQRQALKDQLKAHIG